MRSSANSWPSMTHRHDRFDAWMKLTGKSERAYYRRAGGDRSKSDSLEKCQSVKVSKRQLVRTTPMAWKLRK